MRILSVMLGKSSDLATRFRTSRIEVVIVSADRPMTTLPEFALLSGTAISEAGASGRKYLTVGELIAKRKRAKLQSSSAFNSKKAFFEKFQQGPGKRP